MQTWMDAITARVDKAEEKISDIEDKIMENSEAEEGNKDNGSWR